ncbi:MAG: UDP-3-O-acyl-N-acetylglucosamine deacetylase [Vampirovibrionales bacterium]|nr:UDP-3-O-acyl-N-acetylglucosamine deacetylase [Vampirovibrionales bacterium]
MSVLSEAMITAGNGLITGQPVEVVLKSRANQTGIIFELYESFDALPVAVIPASVAAVADASRGVTLIDPARGVTLSIVEHFLAACALTNRLDVCVQIKMAAGTKKFELPLLDGSAQGWIPPLMRLDASERSLTLALDAQTLACSYRHNDDIMLYAMPLPPQTDGSSAAEPVLQLTYAVNFKHPDLCNRYARWDAASDGPEAIASAGTFGYLSELPAMQAMGLALGVTEDNTLGLTDAGGYTRPLRMDDEPIKHKMLDLIGDLTLVMGEYVNPLQLPLHIVALQAGHASHIAFGKLLAKKLNLPS